MTDTLSILLPEAQMLNNKDIVYEVLRPLYGNPSSPGALHKTMGAFFKNEGFDTIGFEESGWLVEDNMMKISMCQLTWMTALLPVNQRTLWPLSRRKSSHGS